MREREEGRGESQTDRQEQKEKESGKEKMIGREKQKFFYSNLCLVG